MSKLSSKQRLQLDGLAADIRRHPQMSVDTMAATVRTICEPPMGRPPSTSPRAVRRRYLLHRRRYLLQQAKDAVRQS